MPRYAIFFLLFILFQTNYLAAQESVNSENTLTGMVVYQQKIDMRTYVVKSDTLKFNRSKSIFSWNLYNNEFGLPSEIKERFPVAQIPEDASITRMTGQQNFYDTTKDSIFSRKSMRQINTILYLEEKKPNINWNISDSTKSIGNYSVQKATTRFRGRDYTAWFTPEIPLPFGPWKLNGLPGLILEAYDQTGNIYFSASNVNLEGIGSIDPITLNGEEKIITLVEYTEIINNFEREMKSATLKKVRGALNGLELSNMKINLPDIELMETFEDRTDQ
jgi:GLPGLI family protein